MSHLFRRFGVRRFKSIVELDLRPEGLTGILLGGNNSGKSATLEAIYFALECARNSLTASTAWQSDACEATLLRSAFPLSNARIDIARALSDDGSTVELELGSGTAKVEIRQAGDALKLGFAGQLAWSQLIGTESVCAFVPGLAGIPIKEAALAPGVAYAALARGDSNLVLRNLLVLLKDQSAAWDDFQEDLVALFEGTSVVIQFKKATDEYVGVSIRQGNREIPLENAGTGLLQGIQLLTYINLLKPRLLLLDEPDAHLHPNNQRRLARLLAKKESTQVLLATHSRHILSAMKGTASAFWISAGQLKEVDGVGVVEALTAIGALDEADEFGGGKLACLVLTEDEKIEMIEAVLWSSGFKKEETLVLSYKGCTNKITIEALCALFRDRLPATKIVLHRDRDYGDEELHSEEDVHAKKNGAKLFRTRGVDVESYFLNTDYLISLGIERVEAERILAAAATQAEEKSRAKMINSRVQIALSRAQRGKFPDIGELAAECHREYLSASEKYLHGKTALKAVFNQLSSANRLPKSPIRQHSSLRDATLASLVTEIWPPTV